MIGERTMVWSTDMGVPVESRGFGQIKAVEAQDLTKLFGATPALRGASLRLKSDEITLLMGPNGAGKSTLLNIIGTMLRPTRGSVRYLDESDRSLSRMEVRSQLGWVSHASHCYGELTGRQNIALAAELHGLGTEGYESLAERLALGRFAERPVSTLSRGQTQRVALARALVVEPSLLLLDEPWTGLDKKSAKLLERIVVEEKERGALVAIVSHEIGLGERLGAREVIVRQGRVDEQTKY